MMKRTFTPNVGSLLVALFLFLSGGLFAQNLTPVAGSTQTIYAPSGGYTSFSDPGGPGGTSSCSGVTIGTAAENYPNCGCMTTVTVCHDVPGTAVELDFTQFGVNAYFDYVVVYDGATTTSPVLYDNGSSGSPQYNDVCTGPGLVTATNTSGCLTVEFYSSTVVEDAGFIANINAGPVSDVDAGLTITNPGTPTTATLQNVEVEIENFGNLPLDSVMVQWEIDGTPQAPFNYTGPALASGAVSAPVVIGTYTPAPGGEIKAWTSMPNGIADTVNVNDTSVLSICIGMAGNYTIDAGQPASATNFTSFSSAVAAMGLCGIAGPVVFDVVPGSGPYTEQVTIPAIQGSSATNTVTFNGNGDTLQYQAPSGNKFILKLDGADYVTFDSLTILSLDATYGFGVLFSNSSDYNTFRKCTIDVSSVTSTSTTNSAAVAFSNSNTSPSSSGNNGSYNRFEDNTFLGGYYSVRINSGGGGYNEFWNNRVLDFYYYGMYFAADNNYTILDGNIISRPLRSSISLFYGIYFTGTSENCVINGNQIHNTAGGNPTSTSNHFGIYHTSCDATAGNENIVSNNLIFNINNNAQINAIYNSGSDGVKYLHNTIDLTNATTTTSSNTYGVYQTTTASDLVFIGNIFNLNRTGSSNHAAFYFNTSTTTFTENFNVVNVVSPTGTNNYGYFNGTSYATLFDWQSGTSQGANSYAADPLFTSPGTGDFTPGNPSFNNIVPNQGITQDINGNPRGASTDPGAIEFSGVPNDIGVFNFLAPVRVVTTGAQNVDVEVRNFGTNTVNTYDLQWTVNGVPQTPTSSTTPLAPSTTSSPISLGTYTPTGVDTITAWTLNPNAGADAFQGNDTLTFISCVGMQGVYSIDAALPTGGTNFASFTDAIDSMLTCGITGPVTFNVTPGSGPYNEQVVVPFINGMGAANPITFNGRGDTLEFSSPSGLKYVMKLDGAQYVTIDSLVIRSLSGTYGIGLMISGGSDNNTLQNSIVDITLTTSTTSSNTAAVAITGSNTSPVSNSAFTGSNNLIQNNILKGGYQTVTVFGASDGTGADNNRFIDNRVEDFYNAGFLLGDNTNTLVQGNDISRPTRTSVTTFHGVEMEGNVYGALVNANRIHNTHGAASSLTGTVYGIYFTSSDADSARVNVVSNNLIYDINNNGTLYGVYTTGSDNNRIYNNTFVFDDPNFSNTSATRGVYQTTAASNVHIKNNIFYITRGGTTDKFGIYLNTSTSDVTIDNNVYFINSPTSSNFVGYYGGGFATIADWRTANTGTYDLNGFQRDPRFVDILNDDYTPTSAIINDQAEPLAAVPTDFFGVARSATPDPGAIEFAPLADDAATLTLLSPAQPFSAGNYPIDVEIQNLGIADLTEVNIYVNIKDGVIDTTLPVFVHSPILLPSIAKDTVTIGTFDFTSPSYTVKVWTSEPNGGPDANTLNDTILVDLCLALPAGNYTINSALPTGGGNYQSFNDVAAALQCGISGDVVFTVATGSGPYSEQVTFTEVPGSGPTATITFEGNGETLTHDASVKYATVVMSGASYFTFNNITLESTSNAQGMAIQLNSQADHNTVKNSTINMSTSVSNSSNVGINASASETSATTDGDNANYLWVDSCMFIGGYRGMDLEGSSTVLLKGNRVTNSTFYHQYNAAMYVDDQDSLIVHNNVIDSLRDQTNGDGLYLFDINGYFEVTNNNISVPDWGIYFNDGNTNDSTNRAKVINNMVRSNADYGMYFVSCSHVDIFHNSVLGNSAIYFATNSTRMDIRNNIFYSPGDYCFEVSVDVLTYNPVDIDYNIYYSGSPSLFALIGGTTTAYQYGSLAAAQLAFPMFNQNSLQGDPVFYNVNSDLHVLGTLANDVGDNTVGITSDIDADTRPLAPASTVDIGADEYLPFANNIAVVAITSPEYGVCGDSSTPVTVVIYNYGTAPQSGFDIQVDITGSATSTLSATYAGPIAPQTYDTVTVGTLNTYAGGIFNLFAQHLLATDQYTANDTLSAFIGALAIPAPPVAVGDTGCVGDFLELSADLTGYVDLEWYDDASLSNSVGSGDLFFTPSLSSSTNYYVVGYTGLIDSAGKPAPTSTGTFITTAAGWGLQFEVTSTVTIKSVTIYPVGTGTVSIGVYDLNAGNSLVAASPVAAVTGSGATTPVVVPVNITVGPGTYNMGLESYTGITNLIRDSGGNSFPYAASSAGISVTYGKTSFTGTTSSSYYWFYDWKVEIPGCVSPATEVLGFISAPVSEAGANDTICVGDTATLTALNGDAWLWTGGSNTQSIDVAPAVTTTYTLTITDQYGCTGTADQATVVVNQLPNVVASNDTAICDGETAALAAIGATDYVWSNTATTPIINVTTADTYVVTGTDANGCVNVDSTVLTVRALPSGNASADVDICEGASTQLDATGGVSYLWSTNETTSDIVVSPTTTTDYTVATTNQFGCVGFDTVTVTVNALPTINITVSDTICISQTNLTLTATPAGGTFSGPGVNNGVFDASLVGVGTYSITYTYTDGNGCANTATKSVYVDGTPGCEPDGIGTIAGLEIGAVYPNPFQDEVTIEFTATSSEPVTINMYDLLGQVIFTAEVDVNYGLNTYTINTDRSLAEGFYVIELRKGEQSYLEKLLRVR